MADFSQKTITTAENGTVVYWLSLAGLAFMLPFSLGDGQSVTGVLVNTALFVAAGVLPKSRIWPVVVLPSLGVLARGVVFGPLTVFLFYLVPFIWVGNLLLVYSFAWWREKAGFLPGVVGSALLKAMWLFLAANLLVGTGLVPIFFLGAMGVYQLLTALAGGVIAWLLLRGMGSGLRQQLPN